MNKILLVGNVAKSAEVRKIGEDREVMSFTLVTTESYKKNGERVSESTFHNIDFFGKNLENFAKYIVKGKPFEIEGKQVNKWDSEAKKNYSSVLAASIKFAPKEWEQDNDSKEDLPF